MTQYRYWMVHGIGRSAPNFQHTTKEAARNEAHRLARANPGSVYVVLKATVGYVADVPNIKKIGLRHRTDDGIPF